MCGGAIRSFCPSLIKISLAAPALILVTMNNFTFEINDDSRFEDLEDGGNSCLEFMDDPDAYSLADLLHLVALQDEEYDQITPAHFICDEDILIWGLSHLLQTSLGRSLAFDARFEDWALEVDDIESGEPQIDSQLRILILPRGTPSLKILSRTPAYQHEFLLNLARGLRLIWQDMNNIRSRFDLTIDDQILLERLRRADQDVVMLRMAWELHEVDDGALWRQVIAHDMTDMPTLVAALWAEEEADIRLHQALLPAFQLYLLSETTLSGVDAATLAEMDKRLNGYESVAGTNILTPQDVLTIGRLPEGGSYLAPLARTLVYAENYRHIYDPLLENHVRQIVADSDQLQSAPLIFHDTKLQEKIFPHCRLDTRA